MGDNPAETAFGQIRLSLYGLINAFTSLEAP